MENRKKKYKIIRKGVFQGMKRFEDVLNDYAKQGWEVISLASNSSYTYALIAKQN